MKGIDKGDIVSSGAPQISKEGSLGWNSTDIQGEPSLVRTFKVFFFSFILLTHFLGKGNDSVWIGMSEQAVEKMCHILLMMVKMKALIIRWVAMEHILMDFLMKGRHHIKGQAQNWK